MPYDAIRPQWVKKMIAATKKKKKTKKTRYTTGTYHSLSIQTIVRHGTLQVPNIHRYTDQHIREH